MGAPDDVNARLRRLPKVDEVLRGEVGRRLLGAAPRWAVVAAVRAEIDGLRERLRAGAATTAGEGDDGDGLDAAALDGRVATLLRPSLRRVINATGVVLHTNLGRAPLHPAAIARVAEVARGYSNLEYRLGERARGSRHEHVAALVCELTGAEAALVVNNCAAAVLLSLGALAAGREVIVSRGELVEIGGSFRVPDVMRASGAKLVEVGTTNRTHPRDYERAITSDTALLLKVHQSNFAVVGFTAAVDAAGLVAVGRARTPAVPVMVDLGSGFLVRPSHAGSSAGGSSAGGSSAGGGSAAPSVGAGEPTVQEVVAAGVDVVTFSGDKLLGGPQAGVILGRREVIDRLRTHPLLRALRPGKLALAALVATLELYRDGRQGEIPALAMLAAPPRLLRARAEALRARLAERAPSLVTRVIEVRSAVGGGALPLDEPPSFAVAVDARAAGFDADALDARLRAATPPVVARIADGCLVADVRTLADADLDEVVDALAAATATATATASVLPTVAASRRLAPVPRERKEP